MSVTTCQLCFCHPPKYSCPRCNIPYCSLDCYKSKVHAQCSETFYKECVMKEMAQLSKNGVEQTDDVKKMYDILKRMEDGSDSEQSFGEEDDLDSDDESFDTELKERLQNVNLNDANAVWEKLTDMEKLDFENILKSDDITRLIDIQQPWWAHKIKPILIVDVSAPSTSETDNQKQINMPDIYKNIVPFKQISSKPPASCLRHNICNVLAAYTITYRYFNGEHLAHPRESSNYLLSICANLMSNGNFDNQELAVDSVANDCRTQNIPIDDEEQNQLRDDVNTILAGPDGCSMNYTLAALSDVHHMFLLAKKCEASSNKSKGEFSKRFMDHDLINSDIVNRIKLSAYMKKLEFYLSYIRQS